MAGAWRVLGGAGRRPGGRVLGAWRGGLGEAALRSMSVKKRVRLIAQSLLTYEHWHPEFEGFAPARVSECAGAMAFPEARGFG